MIIICSTQHIHAEIAGFTDELAQAATGMMVMNWPLDHGNI